MAPRTSGPIWDEVRLPKYERLSRPARFDVVVIGGGMTGLSAAYFLKQAGKTVCVLERDRLGSGDTAMTTAHLTCVTDMRLSQLVKNFGREEAALVWYAGLAACDMIEQIVEENAIECQFQRVPAFLHAALNSLEDERPQLRDEATLARELGFDVDYLEEVPVVHKPGIRVRDQAKFHPRAYLAGLARAIDGDGSRIYEQSEVTEFQDDALAVKANGRQIECDDLVIATHVPLVGKAGMLQAALFQSKLAPYSSYVVSGQLPRGAFAEVSLWDTSDPYYYLRIDRDGDRDRVIFGGNDHKTGQESDTSARFERLAVTLLGILPGATLDRQWSGQIIETHDGLPFIGEAAERQFVATGFCGNGITFGTLAGLMARDWVLGNENPWQELFSVDRKSIRGGAWDYIKENLDFPYYYLADRLRPPPKDSARGIRRGTGEVLRVDGERMACFRDDKGKLTRVSAVCTHMGCLVRWNGAEHTWDCPCHGSRFSTSGQVLAGPAESPLEPAPAKGNVESNEVQFQEAKHLHSRSASMKLDTMETLLVHELKDLLSAEKQLLKALPKMAKGAANPSLATAFEEHLEQTKTHVNRLEQAFSALDKAARAEHCKGMEGLIEEGAKLLEEDGEEAVKDAALIGAAQRVEHYEIAGYGTARTLAELLGHAKVAALLQQTLDEEKETDEKLTALAMSEVNPQAQAAGGE